MHKLVEPDFDLNQLALKFLLMEGSIDPHAATMARRNEISGLLKNETHHVIRIEELSTDLQAFKSAYSAEARVKRELEEEYTKMKLESEAYKRDLEAQISVLRGSIERRVVCLIDGDGAIFSPELIAQGHDGGLLAAKMLTESVRQDFYKYQLDQYHLYVYVFYNKRGLVDAIGRAGHWIAKQKFDEFTFGFNQAAERFMMVDVGTGKEQADAKIKGELLLLISLVSLS
ncbi:hypothetical protein HWV62_18392 [Athelia sp. TMB]|nr:hypothetical protein HWV62_18392 [Athelia sp. TMB]